MKDATGMTLSARESAKGPSGVLTLVFVHVLCGRKVVCIEGNQEWGPTKPLSCMESVCTSLWDRKFPVLVKTPIFLGNIPERSAYYVRIYCPV